MLNETQIAWVKKQLVTKGNVTRNQCLRRYISRLSAIIFILKERGMKISGRYIEVNGGRDFIYERKK